VLKSVSQLQTSTALCEMARQISAHVVPVCCADKPVILLATIGPNTLSTDDEKVIECKANCVLRVTFIQSSAQEGATVTYFTAHVVADELSADRLRRHDRYLKVRDRALAHVLDDDSA
jgi:hypothetical protein